MKQTGDLCIASSTIGFGWSRLGLIPMGSTVGVQPGETTGSRQHQQAAHQLGNPQASLTCRWKRTDAKRVDAKSFNPDATEAVPQQIDTTQCA